MRGGARRDGASACYFVTVSSRYGMGRKPIGGCAMKRLLVSIAAVSDRFDAIFHPDPAQPRLPDEQATSTFHTEPGD
jgi:hypothetical protein